MRRVEVRRPSFPTVAHDQPLEFASGEVWQVMCGDTEHWRAGIYSPALCRLAEITEFEQHTCPELFILLEGRLTLVFSRPGGELEELPLPLRQPVLVNSPHNGYCPDGPHTGRCLVIERDHFQTVYRTADESNA